MMKSLFKETNKYKFLATIRYLGDGFFYPFFALYLTSRELTESHIGFILSISPLLAILLNPVYSKFCKNPKKTKDTLMVVTVLEAITIILVSLSSNFYIISSLTLLMAIFGSCHYGLMDALTALYCEKTNINYSSIRVFGSAAYIVATALSGIICDVSFQGAFIISGILFILSGIFYYIITPIDVDDDKNEKNEEVKIIELFKNKELMYFAIIYMLLQGVTKSSDNFYSVYLESRGINSTQFGFVYSYFVFFEVISLIIFNKLLKRRDNTYILLLISTICLTIRTLANFLYLPVIIVILISCLRGIGFAIVLHVTYEYIIKIVGERKGTKAVMLVTLFYSIYLFIFSNVNGVIIDNYSYKSFYFINLCICLLTIILIIIKILLNKKRNIKQ